MSDELRGVPELIVAAIIKDLRGRMGLGQTWDEIDVDVRNAIAHKWIALAQAECSNHSTQAARITELEAQIDALLLLLYPQPGPARHREGGGKREQ